MAYDFLANRMYRMPTHFGPALGPRHNPDGGRYDWSEHEFDAVSASFLSERSALEALLPPGFELYGEPVVKMTFAYLRNLPWLAGRGYNTLGVNIPARYKGKTDTVIGSLCLVLWENMADPIITGREELGVAKIYCDLPPPRINAGRMNCEASWYGFRFLDMDLDGLRDADLAKDRLDPGPDTQNNLLHYKYMPRTGEWGTRRRRPCDPVAFAVWRRCGQRQDRQWDDPATAPNLGGHADAIPYRQHAGRPSRPPSPGSLDDNDTGRQFRPP